MPSYHFDLGNSTDGPVGYSARIQADTPEDAVAVLQKAIDQIQYGVMALESKDYDAGQVEYIEIYFNPRLISIDDINGVDDGYGNELDLGEALASSPHME